MNINGKNGLACLLYIEPSPAAIEIQPLPHTYVVKESEGERMRVLGCLCPSWDVQDLVPDLTNFYNQCTFGQRVGLPWKDAHATLPGTSQSSPG